MALSYNLVGNRFQRLFPARDGRELAAFVGEHLGDAATDSHASTCNERDLAGELQVHWLALDLRGERLAVQVAPVPDRIVQERSVAQHPATSHRRVDDLALEFPAVVN